MWIVKLALRRPHTVAVLCVLLLFFGTFSALRMRADILPAIDIPIALVVWSYTGLPADEVEKRIVHPSERAYSMTVAGISHIESRSTVGMGLLRISFQPGTDIGAAIAQINSVSATATTNMPPGTKPPIVIPYNAGNVPVAQLTIASPTHSEEELVEYAMQGVRLRLFTIPGLATPAPYGGRWRQINVDVDSAAATIRHISTQEVLRALLDANPNLPGGIARIGSTEYNVSINNNPSSIDELKRITIESIGGVPVRLGDVANVYDGTDVQDTIVRVNGRRAIYMAIVRKADASTLAVVDATKELLPLLRKTAPSGIEVNLASDQSIYVRAAMTGVLREAAMAAILVTLLVLFALGSWRSVIIVATSIPLAIGAALMGLKATGQTLNVMTLGGLSLAIGMLVDDATVEVENIDRNLALGRPLGTAILDGARQIATPTLAATLSTCIVFTPVLLLDGAARSLFVPLALSVVFAMLASYLLSRTLVPTLAERLLGRHAPAADDARGFWAALNRRRNRALGTLEAVYENVLRVTLSRRHFFVACGLAAFVIVATLVQLVGVDYFPDVDTGLMKLHVRAPIGTRLEETEQLLSRVEQQIRATIPARELDTINDTIGLPTSYNVAFVQSDSIGPEDADLTISLRRPHRPSAQYRAQLRQILPRAFPHVSFYFQPADIISQVLNPGASAPIDVQIEGRDLDKSAELARALRDKLRDIPGAVDVRVAQPFKHPALRIDVDRERAAAVGLSQRDVANTVLTTLSSSGIVAPSYWLDPESSSTYLVAVQGQPLRDLDQIRRLPLTNVGGHAAPGAPATQLAEVASVELAQATPVVFHDNVQRVVDVQCSVDGRDLGSVLREVQRVVDGLGPLPLGVRVRVRGLSETLASTFHQLALGLLIAALLVYLLLVVLFQSLIDPLIVMIAVPGALAGVLLVLALTGTSLNVESFMGSIMAVGLAVSNSTLLVSFLKETERAHAGSFAAAIAAARTRLRPVLMTATAMILGMAPMALGFGEAGDQNAPLGRAVIGGLLGATASTLFVVPTAYAIVRRRRRSVAAPDLLPAAGDARA